MQSRKRRWLGALRYVGLAVALVLVGRVLRAADADKVFGLVGRVGWAGALVLVPQLVALSFESFGWKLSFGVSGARTRFRSLLRVRVATEALAQSLPVGVAFCESVKPLLLGRHCGLSVDQSVAGMTARKVLLLLSQCFYVAGLSLLGFAGLEAASRAVLGVPHLGCFALGAGVTLGLLGAGAALALRRSALARSVLSLLEKVPVARLQGWLAQRRRWFFATDGAVSEFFRAHPRRMVVPSVFFLCGWLTESAETWLILQVLGVHVSFVTAGSLEVVLSLVRNVVFVVPAGLGVQDMGYAACLAAIGVPEAASVGAAFILLKRGKELFWIAVGYTLLWGDFGALSAARQRVGKLSPANA